MMTQNVGCNLGEGRKIVRIYIDIKNQVIFSGYWVTFWLMYPILPEHLPIRVCPTGFLVFKKAFHLWCRKLSSVMVGFRVCASAVSVYLSPHPYVIFVACTSSRRHISKTSLSFFCAKKSSLARKWHYLPFLLQQIPGYLVVFLTKIMVIRTIVLQLCRKLLCPDHLSATSTEMSLHLPFHILTFLFEPFSEKSYQSHP